MLSIRTATTKDAPMLATMIRELAEFERELKQVDITSEDLIRDGFQSSPCFRALIAEWSGQTAAYAVYFFTYSTWAGRSSLFIEDLFVRPEFRRKGIGKALLKHMAMIARKRSCYGMRWEVLNWNVSLSISIDPLEPNYKKSGFRCSSWGTASKSLRMGLSDFECYTHWSAAIRRVGTHLANTHRFVHAIAVDDGHPVEASIEQTVVPAYGLQAKVRPSAGTSPGRTPTSRSRRYFLGKEPQAPESCRGPSS